MGWTMFYLFVALKVPILMACWIVWWAVHQVPDLADDEDGTGGGGQHRRPHPPAPLPHAPRRGPHGEPALPGPSRVRPLNARARPPEREHSR
jgi:hypothetical protein